MKINPEKILRHAETRLSIHPESGDQDWVDLFKKFLKVETHRLFMAHRFGAEGLQIARDRSYLMDVLIEHILNFASPSPSSSMIALGGYGRQELNPFSDIDILFLLKKKPDEAQDKLIKRILYLLWDIGLKVGHAVRTIPDAVEEGRRDFKSRTSMMEARFIVGDREHFEEFQKIFSKACLQKDISTYVQLKLEEIKVRHERYKRTVYLQEPHVKEGVGGLRDINSCLWIYQALHGYRSFEELSQHGILSKNDLKVVHRSLNFIHRVRNELHFLSGKCFDILSLPLQPKVARNLGFKDTRIFKMSEAFMKDYYLHARDIDQITQRLLSRDEVQTQLKIRFPGKFISRHGLSFTEDEILSGKNPDHFRENPQKLFEVFLYCAHGNYRLSQELAQQIREHLYLVDKKIQGSPEARNIFIAIMGYEGSMIGALRAMHDTGLLGKYIPEFGRATCFVQHDFYHQYTLDEHTLKAVEFLDELKRAKDPRLEGFSKVLKEVQHRDVAFLSVFFHDIGKIQGRDHSVKGAKLVEEILKRIQYDKEKTERVRFAVENHLMMAHLSQRRDLSEEKVIMDFAKKMGDVENLRILHLLTYADSRATGEDVWNEWKEALLWELYFKTKRYLEEKVVLLPSEVQAIKDSYIDALTKKNIPHSVIADHLEMLPINYLQSYRPETVEAHLRIISEIDKSDPEILWEHNPKTNTTELTVCTKDLIGLFSEITGTIASQDVNILSANIFTRKDGIVIDKFSLENPYERAILSERIRNKISQGLASVIQRRCTVEELLKQRAAQATVSPQPSPPPIIKFDNDTSLATTIVEIQADDQIGFLYKVTRTFSKLGLNIHLAKIATEKAQIYDVFYITDYDGKKIDHPKVQRAIAEEIEKAVQSSLESI